MNIWADIFQLLAQREPEDGDNALKKILPLLVIMLLYGLSGLLKGKKPKKPSLPTEAQSKYKPIEQAESAQQQRLPSYARKATIRPQPVQPRPVQSRPAPQPTLTSPTRVAGEPPSRRPLPPRRAMPMPSRPTRPAPAPARPGEIQVPPAQHPAPARKTAAGAIAAAAPQVRQKSSEAREIRVPTETSRDKLLRALRQSNEAARGIVYGEILGKPLALREGGVYEF